MTIILGYIFFPGALKMVLLCEQVEYIHVENCLYSSSFGFRGDGFSSSSSDGALFILINFFGVDSFGDSTSMDMVQLNIGLEIGSCCGCGPLLLPIFIGLVSIESSFIRSFMYDSNKFIPLSWVSVASFM